MGHLRLHYLGYVGDRFYVPPTEKQLQITGRLWRHGLTMMPDIIAGVGGPAEEQFARHADEAPAQAVEQRRRSPQDNEELFDGHEPDGFALEAAEEVLPDPVVPNIVTSDKYRWLFGDDPFHIPVLEVYCLMAVLGGCLMSDNIADTIHMSELQMCDLADEARDFIVDHYDLLFGPAHTTKAHSLAHHLLAALLGYGNLWEGDTSENEALHGPCKKMITRPNRRGPITAVQMMRAAESKAEVLREIRELELEHAKGDDGLHCLLKDDADAGDVAMNTTVALSRSHRCLRISVADAEQLPGMEGLGMLLSREASYSFVVSSSFTSHCLFEWGASSVVQTACAIESHLAKPRFD